MFFILLIIDSPRQIKIDGGTSVKNGSKVKFICSADANPPPNSYSWKHTSTSESLPLSFSNTTGVLTIDTVTIQHEGKYTCAVTNDIGTSETSINIMVLCKYLFRYIQTYSIIIRIRILSDQCSFKLQQILQPPKH